MICKTTREFLIHFGLKELNELPTIEEFEEIIKTEAAAEQLTFEEASEVEQPQSGIGSAAMESHLQELDTEFK